MDIFDIYLKRYSGTRILSLDNNPSKNYKTYITHGSYFKRRILFVNKPHPNFTSNHTTGSLH